MKKILAVLLTAVMMLSILAQTAMAADVAPKFSEKFFPSGKANVPTDIYYQIGKDDSGRTENVYVWLTQPDDIIDMFAEWSYLGRDEFEKTYGCTIERCYIQVDCKVDNGDWHYVSEWDKDEYPQANQPYDLMIRQKIVASEEQKTYREGCALIDPWYGQDDENAGYLKSVVYSKGDKWYLDLDNHSLTLRMRYIIAYTNWNMTEEERGAAGGEDTAFILSDWSEEITIGQNATQKELVYPQAIEAPVISELTFVESVERGDGYSDTTWKLYVDFPKSNGEAQKYYSIEMDAWGPLCAVMQYRVQTDGEWGEWKDTDWGNPQWLYSGWKNIVTEEVSKDDTVEFRAYLKNYAEEGKDSPYTNSLFCNAGDSRQEPGAQSGTNNPGGNLDNGTGTNSKCKVCGICPFQPLGICLFIWLAIILIVVVVVIILISKGKKKNKNKEGRGVTVMAFCSKCGSQLNEGEKFCPSCGETVGYETKEAANPTQPAQTDFSQKIADLNNTADTTAEYDAQDIQNNKAMAILAYLSWLVLIPLFAAKESKFARFHCNQGIVLAVAEIIAVIVLSILDGLPLIGWIFSIAGSLLGLVCFLFAVLGIINVANGKAKELPIIGKFKILK